MRNTSAEITRQIESLGPDERCEECKRTGRRFCGCLMPGEIVKVNRHRYINEIENPVTVVCLCDKVQFGSHVEPGFMAEYVNGERSYFQMRDLA